MPNDSYSSLIPTLPRRARPRLLPDEINRLEEILRTWASDDYVELRRMVNATNTANGWCRWVSVRVLKSAIAAQPQQRCTVDSLRHFLERWWEATHPPQPGQPPRVLNSWVLTAADVRQRAAYGDETAQAILDDGPSIGWRLGDNPWTIAARDLTAVPKWRDVELLLDY